MEECSLKATKLTRLGYIVFNMEHLNSVMRVHVYDCWDFEGEPIESDEMRPQWYSEDDIPFERMWPDDPFWFEYMKARTPFFGK
jgi:8-oxo-dGTP diphosphatase/2-hydroxy-dATP diphosphatase